jgi:hypothetical protein
MCAAGSMATSGCGYQGKTEMSAEGYECRDFIGVHEEMAMRTMFPEEGSLGSGKANNTPFREKKIEW